MAIDSSLLVALNIVAQSQAAPTTHTLTLCRHMLDYCATFQQSKVCYHASDMVLHVDSDPAYLVAPHAKSRVAGYFQLSNKKYPTNPSMFLNGACLVECKTLRHVVASSAESETAVAFHNAQFALPIRYMLSQLGHPKPPTPFRIDNQATTNFIKNNINEKKFKYWNMRFYWLRDQSINNNFQFYSDKSTNNIADFFTKKHNIQYHVSSKNKYLNYA